MQSKNIKSSQAPYSIHYLFGITLKHYESKNVRGLHQILSKKNKSHRAMIFLNIPLVSFQKLLRSKLFSYTSWNKPNDAVTNSYCDFYKYAHS
jgi:hypothetical protein